MSIDQNNLHCETCSIAFGEDSTYYVVGDECYCGQCYYKEGFLESGILYLISDNRHCRVIDSKNIINLEDGIYAIESLRKYTIIIEAFPKDISAQCCLDKISESINKGYAVLEKKQGIYVIRFPKYQIVSKMKLDTSYPTYSAYLTLLYVVGASQKSFIGRNDDIMGICVCRSQTDIDEFVTCDGGYDIISESALKEYKNNLKSAQKVYDALQNVVPSVMLDYFEKRLVGQGVETKKIVYTFYEYFRCVAAAMPFVAQNWILTAPSGCGKTEVYRTLRDFCKEYSIPIPIVQIDLSQYTEAGYKGKEIAEIVEQIAEKDKTSSGTAICFLDEADKKCLPSYTSKGDDVNAAVQANLLAIIEENEVKVEDVTFDTGKTMFVLMGAFQSIRDRKQEKKEEHSSIGFGVRQVNKERSSRVDDCFYEDITLDDMIEYGMLEELAGRMTQVINLHKLSETDMRTLLTGKVGAIAKELGVIIELTENAMDSLIDISYSALGIRRPINCIRSLAGNALAEHYFDKDFDKKRCKILIRSADEADVLLLKEKLGLETTA